MVERVFGGRPMSPTAGLEARLQLDGKVVLRTSTPQLLLSLFGCLAISAVCVAVLVAGSDSAGAPLIGICIAGLILFGVAGLPISIYQIVTGRPNVVVSRDGVAMGEQFVSWPEVREVRMKKYRRAKFVILKVDPAVAETYKKPWTWHRLITAGSTFAVKGPYLSLPPGLNVRAERLTTWLSDLAQRFGQPEPYAS